jgi:hypothetical protein
MKQAMTTRAPTPDRAAPRRSELHRHVAEAQRIKRANRRRLRRMVLTGG